MTAADPTQRPSLRSQRLNQITHEPHAKLDALVKAHAPFETQANFARFVVAQYLFQSELVALYNDAELIKIVPDLPERCRAEAAKLDLGVEVSQVGLGGFGAAALCQVGDDGDQLGIVVQRHQFRLEQVLRHHETGEVGLGLKRRVGFDQGIEFGVGLVCDLVQAL